MPAGSEAKSRLLSRFMMQKERPNAHGVARPAAGGVRRVTTAPGQNSPSSRFTRAPSALFQYGKGDFMLVDRCIQAVYHAVIPPVRQDGGPRRELCRFLRFSAGKFRGSRRSRAHPGRRCLLSTQVSTVCGARGGLHRRAHRRQCSTWNIRAVQQPCAADQPHRVRSSSSAITAASAVRPSGPKLKLQTDRVPAGICLKQKGTFGRNGRRPSPAWRSEGKLHDAHGSPAPRTPARAASQSLQMLDPFRDAHPPDRSCGPSELTMAPVWSDRAHATAPVVVCCGPKGQPRSGADQGHVSRPVRNRGQPQNRGRTVWWTGPSPAWLVRPLLHHAFRRQQAAAPLLRGKLHVSGPVSILPVEAPALRSAAPGCRRSAFTHSSRCVSSASGVPATCRPPRISARGAT